MLTFPTWPPHHVTEDYEDYGRVTLVILPCNTRNPWYNPHNPHNTRYNPRNPRNPWYNPRKPHNTHNSDCTACNPCL